MADIADELSFQSKMPSITCWLYFFTFFSFTILSPGFQTALVASIKAPQVLLHTAPQKDFLKVLLLNVWSMGRSVTEPIQRLAESESVFLTKSSSDYFCRDFNFITIIFCILFHFSFYLVLPRGYN